MVDTWKSHTRVMFHATHRDNIPSIWDNGLSPDFSTGKMKAVWFTPKVGIQSAIVHAAYRHGWKVDDIEVIAIIVYSEAVRYSGNGFFYYSKGKCTAQSHVPASVYLQESEEN
jgi:hypothetical protein